MPKRSSQNPVTKKDVPRPNFTVHQDLAKNLGPKGKFGNLLARSPEGAAKATTDLDGRSTRLVLARVTFEGSRRPAGGVLAELRSRDGQLLDFARVDRRGLVLLRLPADGGDLSQEVGVELRLSGGPSASVVIPAQKQFALLPLEAPKDLETSPPLADVVDTVSDLTETVEGLVDAVEESGSETSGSATEESGETGSASAPDETALADEIADAAKAVANAASELQDAAEAISAHVPDDSVVSRLPSVFSSDLGETLVYLLAGGVVPIPGVDPGCNDEIKRNTLIKHLTIRRTVGSPPRRFVVRLRQDWTFVHFALGELTLVDPMDVGTVTGTLDATLAAQARLAADLALQTETYLAAAAEAEASMTSSIESILEMAASLNMDAHLWATARAGISGFGVRTTGGADFWSNVDFDSRTQLNVDTSLLASTRMSTATSLVNKSKISGLLGLDAHARLTTRAAARINPSLARQINLLRFVLYETYLVTTNVEEVFEILEVDVFKPVKWWPHPLLGPLPASSLYFGPDEILHYRALFEPRLLDRSLAPRYEYLYQQLTERWTRSSQVRHVWVEIDYALASLWSIGGRVMDLKGQLSVEIAGSSVVIPLNREGTRSSGILKLDPPATLADLSVAKLVLSLEGLGSAAVTAVRLRFSRATAQHTYALGAGELRVDFTKSIAEHEIPLHDIELPEYPLENDPLVKHINAHPHYYLGIVAEAAVAIPSLRSDSPHLSQVRADHDLWKLPIIGFEADRALVLAQPTDAEEEVSTIMADEGSSTLVQIAAGGLYTELATGCTQVSEVAGVPHPGLFMPVPPLPVITGHEVLSGLGGIGVPSNLGPLAAAMNAGAGQVPLSTSNLPNGFGSVPGMSPAGGMSPMEVMQTIQTLRNMAPKEEDLGG